MLILPGDPEFNHALLNVPPGWQQNAGNSTFVVDALTGLIRQINQSELDEYMFGGEYDMVMSDEFLD